MIGRQFTRSSSQPPKCTVMLECGHEYLLSFSCKGRYFCTSCHTKRAVAFSEWLNDTVLWAVPHRQIVLTVPKMLRPYFRYDRRLLGKLCRVASRVITKSFRALTGRQDITVGMVACVQTFGNFANFHPHLHILVTDGGFGLNGTFYVLPKVSLFGLEQLFRHRVLKMMLRAGLITPQRVKLLLSWKHSGFNVDGSVRVRASNRQGRENISRYLIRAPFSVDKIQYSCREGSVIRIRNNYVSVPLRPHLGCSTPAETSMLERSSLSGQPHAVTGDRRFGLILKNLPSPSSGVLCLCAEVCQSH